MQTLRVLVADAAHDRLRQGDRADADEDPLRQVEPHWHVAARERLEHLRVVGMDIRHDGRVAAARLEDVVEQERNADHHHDGTARIRDGHGTEAADARVEHDDESEEQEAHLIAVSRDRREELRAADELRRHRAAEEQHDDEGRERRQSVRLEALADDVDDRDRVEAAREHGHALAEDAEHKEDGRDLHDRHVDPAETDLPGHARPADERADGTVRRHRRHREHKAAEVVIADEIRLHEVLAGILPAHPEADCHHEAHKNEQRQQGGKISLTCHGGPPLPNRQGSCPQIRSPLRS